MRRALNVLNTGALQLLCSVLCIGALAPVDLSASSCCGAVDYNGKTLGSMCGSNCCVPEYDPGPLPQPLTLEKAEKFALRHNKTLRSLRWAVVSGAWKRCDARSKFAPKLSLEATITRSDFRAENPSTSIKEKLTVDQIIYDTASYYGVCAADLDARQLEISLLSLTNNILFDVRSAYYEMIVSEEELQVQEENVQILGDALRREERKYEVGESTKFDVRQSKVAVANALSSYYRSVRNYKVAQNTLLTALGLEPNDDVQLVIEERDIPVMAVPLLRAKAESLGWTEGRTEEEKNDLVAETFRVYSQDDASRDRIFSEADIWLWEQRAMDARPAIKRSCVNLMKARNTLNSRYGERHPKITFSATGTNNAGSSFHIHKKFMEGEFGGKLTWCLFDAGRHFRIRSARSERCDAMVKYEEEVQQTKRVIADSFHDLEGALLSYFAATQSVILAEEAIELAANRRDLGVITPLEYRDVANSLTTARQQFNRASFTLMRSYYSLRREAGVDVEDNACMLLGCYG
ncbi:MAG: TolC family protein [Chlamydiia bacterium]|nr:TolC family protein [Chlamydiia bacterium]